MNRHQTDKQFHLLSISFLIHPITAHGQYIKTLSSSMVLSILSLATSTPSSVLAFLSAGVAFLAISSFWKPISLTLQGSAPITQAYKREKKASPFISPSYSWRASLLKLGLVSRESSRINESIGRLHQPQQTFGLRRLALTHSTAADWTLISTESPHSAPCTSNPAGFKASPSSKAVDH